jgi:hypothetical protein
MNKESHVMQEKYAPPRISGVIRWLPLAALTVFALLNTTAVKAQSAADRGKERRISVAEYRDKMMAGWIGQMAGVGWGAPTEFEWQSEIIPADEVPEWVPAMVNQYVQDDLYVEMTFLRSMELYGLDVSINQAGIDFANSGYMLWVANAAGRDNLREGIAPPNSGHPKYNNASDAIDYQIEADYSGLIAPGLPNMAIALGEKFGRLMNYGDGLYGGQFVGAMYAEAFFEDDPVEIVKAGLKAIPEGSQYAEAVRDVLQWHHENPDDWEATWRLINAKYHENPDYRKFTFGDIWEDFNIDAKLNGAYIVMGLLYGNGDPDSTIIISMRCGQDSDCNPSNAGGILFTTMGYKNLPERFISALDREPKFSYTEYNFPALINVCEQLAVQAVTMAGGRMETNTAGEEVFVIPSQETVPSALEQSWEPGPVSDNKFSKEERVQLRSNRWLKWVLPILVLLALVVFSENRNIKAAAILIPAVVIVVVAEILRGTLFADMADFVDLATVLESMAAAGALLLLVGQRLKPMRWYISLGAAAVVLAAAAYLGINGANEGWENASSGTTFITYAVMAAIWLGAFMITARLSRNKTGRLRINGLLVLICIITNLLLLFILSTTIKSESIEWLAEDVSLVLMLVVTLPYLVLAYSSAMYGQRLNDWLGLGEAEAIE